MYDTLAGIRVLEVAHYAFVPSAGTVLADWGAEVIKVVHPEQGDPMRHTALGRLGTLPSGISHLWEMLNRGKRCIGVDIANEDGKVILDKLTEQADVFLTSFLPPVRERLGIDVEGVRRVNPRIIYARGTAHGPLGPERDAGGFDLNSYWARSGIAHVVSETLQVPPSMPLPAMGDLPSGFALAAGVTGALLQRERTGRSPIVDVSLLGSAMWANGPHLMAGAEGDVEAAGPVFRNALARPYETKDGRYIYFAGLRLDLYWEDFCLHIGRPDLAVDEQFQGTNRETNGAELGAILVGVIAQETIAHWSAVFLDMDIPWGVVQTPHEIHFDPQAKANGYVVPEVVTNNGETVHMTATPVQFDEQALAVEPAPEPGQHTEEVLLELGYDWGDITRLKDARAIG